MSTYRPFDTCCVACRHVFRVELARGLQISRQPEAREKILNGTYNVFACPECKTATVIETTLVYTDFERLHYIATETPRTATYQTAKARHQTLFRNAFESGPPLVQELAADVKRRVVFGFRALREKLVLWEAGLDDRVVEAVKGDLVAETREKPSDLVLRISRVLDGGHLMFAVYPSSPVPPHLAVEEPWQTTLPAPLDFMTAPNAHYQRRAAEPSKIGRDFPWLDADWFVDVHDGPSFMYR